MLKISPIRESLVRNIVKPNGENSGAVSKVANRLPSCSEVAMPILATGCILSTFLQDFNKTKEENYFQFKINSETGKPFEPDRFQTAAAMNLYYGNDVLVTAPTGTGKTAIAEYVITKNLKDGYKTFYTTPLKALSNEKFREFSKIYGDENVGILTGDTKININAPIVVMTTEVYRNMVANQQFSYNHNKSNSMIDNLKTVVFDELQYLGDEDRGGVWEQSIMFTPAKVQILSLSATIGNNEEINNWIALTKRNTPIQVTPDSKYIPENNENKCSVLVNVPAENRHVPLDYIIEQTYANLKMPSLPTKKVKVNSSLNNDSKSICAKPGPESYNFLTSKLNRTGKLPAIYFVFSRNECRSLLDYLYKNGETLTNSDERFEIENILNEYRKKGVYLGETLDVDAIKKGYAIHNAGMLPSQKTLVEELFQKKLIKVVLATETLSAGINMPAKTTVISSPRKPVTEGDGEEDHKRNLTANEFHQMAGRAGRRGIDSHGYCISLSCNDEQRHVYDELISEPSNPLKSNLDLDYSFITSFMSEFFDVEVLKYILSKSLYVQTEDCQVDVNKLDNIMSRYQIRRDILESNNYIDKYGILTIKGHLISNLNGYEQIPIVNMIANKSFEDLDAVQLAGIAGGLANMLHGEIGELQAKQFKIDTEDDPLFLNTCIEAQEEVKAYQEASAKLYPNREISVNATATEHLYNWANLNNESSKSRKNWMILLKNDLNVSIKDEGALYKEISSTVDLLNQINNIAKKALELAESSEDKFYYEDLRQKCEEAVALIKREPVDFVSI